MNKIPILMLEYFSSPNDYAYLTSLGQLTISHGRIYMNYTIHGKMQLKIDKHRVTHDVISVDGRNYFVIYQSV